MDGVTSEIEISETNSSRRLRQTHIYLPLALDEDHVDTINLWVGTNGSKESMTNNSEESLATLMIPIDVVESNGQRRLCNESTIDEHIVAGYYPVLLHLNESLLQQNPIILLPENHSRSEVATESTQLSSGTSITSSVSQSQRILYVGQGEIAHCTPSQVDVLVSDRATTCHILALRSSSVGGTGNDNMTLCTIAHIDSINYNLCIHDAVQTHYEFHLSGSESDMVKPLSIKLSIHIVGGFKDPSGQSRTITIWIMNLLADLADQYSTKTPSMTMILRTACMTAANHNNKSNGPVIRGLALDCRTGNVFVAHAKYPCPAKDLRHAKLWVSGHSPNSCDPVVSKLRIIHTHHNDMVVIEPLFVHESRRCYCGFIQEQMQLQFRSLLGIRDDTILLQCCSTSPEHEEDDFCDAIRSAFVYVLKEYNTTPRTVSSLLRFTRVDSNTWMQLQEVNFIKDTM